MQKTSLNGEWQLTYGPQTGQLPADSATLQAAGLPTIPATVPGNVELDLMAAGKLPDITKGNNIYLLREYETYQWWYSRTFESPKLTDAQRAVLAFDGLDCIASVWVNDQLVGESANMLIPHRFDITEYLAAGAGTNTLTVHLSSAVLEGRKHSPEPMEWAFTYAAESLAVRKAPHMYGWDIMPRVVSAGIWRDVNLEIVEPTRIQSTYWTTNEVDTNANTATVRVIWNLVSNKLCIDELIVRVTLTRNGDTKHQSDHRVTSHCSRCEIELTDVAFWWPRGYGDPNLYNATVELIDTDGIVLDADTCEIGVRTIRLELTDVTSEDKPGEFAFIVNGVKVYVKGTNWVPLDALHSRDKQHLASAVDMLADLNCNMIRCWGGNVYEDHDFFDLCDASGIMVWQDFAMACAIYPQSDEFAKVIEHEAAVIVSRLRNHASLALWAGNNEIDQCFEWSGTQLDPNTERLSRQVLPAIVRRCDPMRDYLPSSPYYSKALIATGDPMKFGPEQHLWGERDDFKGTFYKDSLAHFVSEIGYHGCPNRQTLEDFLDAEHVWPWQHNDQWITHAVRPTPESPDYDYRIELMAKQIEFLFGSVPENLDDYIFASQASQGEANKFFIESWRQQKPRRTGMLWWNLRDGWPIFSDAIVDYYNRKKLAYPIIKRCQTNICASCTESVKGVHHIVINNDTLLPTSGSVIVRDAETDGVLLEESFHIDPNGCITCGQLPQIDSPAMWIIEMQIDGETLVNHYLAGPRPFAMSDYRRWLEKAGIAR